MTNMSLSRQRAVGVRQANGIELLAAEIGRDSAVAVGASGSRTASSAPDNGVAVSVVV